MRSLFVLSILVVFALTGCSQSQILKGAVDRYCSVPEASRVANREAVAVAVAPHRVEISCGLEETDS
jgi:outer membrane lipoprotein SlyB